MERSDVIVMVARQRSGTNALRDVLAGHPDIFCTPEVFHAWPSPDAELEVETNFFRFLEEHPLGDVKRSTAFETQERILFDFLEFLRGFTDKRYVVVDVKYNSTHHLDGPWRAVSAPPSLFRFMRGGGVRTLNVTRRNYLRWYLSWQKADRNQQWTQRDGASPEEEAIHIKVQDLLWNMNACAVEDAMVKEALWHERRFMRLDYVELFPTHGEGLSRDALARLTSWLGIAPHFETTRPQYRKQSALGLRDTIENYDEVAEALADTPFVHCLEDEPLYRTTARDLA